MSILINDTISAEAFKDQQGWGYTFPIKAWDKEWGLLIVNAEILSHKDYIKHLLLSFHTPDRRYKGKAFDIPLYTERLSSFHTGNGNCLSFFENLDWVVPCALHKGTILRSAAPRNTVSLKVSPLSTMTSIWYEKELSR